MPYDISGVALCFYKKNYNIQKAIPLIRRMALFCNPYSF